MTNPTPRTAKIEIRQDQRGILKAYFNGERIPASRIDIEQGMGGRAEINLKLVGPIVRFVMEDDEVHDCTRPLPSGM